MYFACQFFAFCVADYKEIVVWDDRFSVELKSGIVVEIEL